MLNNERFKKMSKVIPMSIYVRGDSEYLEENLEFNPVEYAEYLTDEFEKEIGYTTVCICRDFRFWNGGDGYGCGNTVVGINGFGFAKTLKNAMEAVAWLATNGKEFPSSEEIKFVFDTLEEN
jgi:hypothetical protein